MINNICILGYGRFGQVLESVVPQIFPDCTVIMAKRDFEKVADADLIIPAVPIREFEEVIKTIIPFLKDTAIVMDVCSVKVYAKKIMLEHLPKQIQILATHPMFGPGTLKKTQGNLRRLKIVVDAVRIDATNEEFISSACRDIGLEMIAMSAEDHDRYAAQFHFTSQFIASVLKNLEIQKTPIDTASVAVLHDFMEFVQTDSLALMQDMLQYNPYCQNQLERIESSVEHIAHTISP
ncbi:prephenate dehydrogenase/arogenate dehydrogenase family protein [soil metagenome]